MDEFENLKSTENYVTNEVILKMKNNVEL